MFTLMWSKWFLFYFYKEQNSQEEPGGGSQVYQANNG